MLKLQTLGGLALTNPQGEISGAAGQRRRLGLLAVLAAAGEAGMSRDRLLALFWPESDDDTARHALKQSVYVLRRELGAPELITGGDQLRLSRSALRCDVWDFNDAIERGDAAAAVEIYRGPLLDGVHLGGAPELDEWIESQRSGCARAYAGALQALAEGFEAQGRLDAAVDMWRKLAATDPLSPVHALRVMRVLAAGGDRAGAIRHARMHASLVENELGAGPDPQVDSFAAELAATQPVERVLPRPLAKVGANRWLPIITVTAIIMIAVIAVVRDRTDAMPAAAPPTRVLVAGFDSGTDSALFAVAAIAVDWLTADLARMAPLSVVHGESVRELRPGQRNALSLASMVGAGTLVTGKVYPLGDSIAIEASVVDVATRTIRHKLDPVFAPRSDPTRALERLRERVVGALAVDIDPRIRNLDVPPRTPPTYEAYRAYTAGLESYERGTEYGVAAAHFVRAAALDTGFINARLWAALAFQADGQREVADSLLTTLATVRSALGRYERAYFDWVVARRSRDQAGQLQAAREMYVASSTPGSALRLASAALNVFRYREALAAVAPVDPFAAGIAHDQPYWHRLLTAQHMLARYLDELATARRFRAAFPNRLAGVMQELPALAALDSVAAVRARIDEAFAMREEQRGQSPVEVCMYGAAELRTHGHAKESAEVGARCLLELAAQTTESPGARIQLAFGYYDAGRYAEARAVLDTLALTGGGGGQRIALAGMIAARTGDRAAALRADSVLSGIEAPNGATSMMRARIAAAWGESATAVQLLRRAIAEGMSPVLEDLHNDVDMQRLTGYPPYQQIVKPRD